MSKRAASKSPEPTALVSPQVKICGICHKPKLGALATAGKIKFMSTHKDICPGKCNDTTCMHKSHKRARAKKPKVSNDDEKAALLAGFKPKEHIDFKETLKRELEKAGMGTNIDEIPGPALSLCVNSIKKYGTSLSTSFSAATSSSSSCGSMNSVIRYLESNGAIPVSSSSPSASSSSVQLQCGNCNWMFVESIKDGVAVGVSCRWCYAGKLALARAGAVMIPELFASAMAVAATSKPTFTVKKEPTTTTTTTQEWPRGKNCNVCNRSIAIQYCTSCLNYLCESELCISTVHDKAGIQTNHCKPCHLIVRDSTHGTRSGRSFTPTRLDISTSASTSTTTPHKPKPTSTWTSSSSLSRVSISSGDDSDIDMDELDDDIMDDPVIVLPTCSKYRDASTQTQVTTVEVEVQTNYNMVFKPLTNMNADVKSIKTEPTAHAVRKDNKLLNVNRIKHETCAPVLGKENKPLN